MDKAVDISAQLLKEDEGVEKFVYPDHMGYLTIAVGRCIDRRKGRGLSDDEIDLMLRNDIKENIRIAQKEIPSFDSLSDNRKAVLVCMYHQLGSLLKWPKFRKAIADKDWAAAEAAGLDSAWAKTQTPARAKRLLSMLKRG